MSALAERYRVVAIDLGGHGASGRNRRAWTIPAFAEDVRAVAQALEVRRAVLVGNSLGGPVALEAARLLRGRVIGVVGVDTLHDLSEVLDADVLAARARAYRRDFDGTCRSMVTHLFHPGAQETLRAWAQARMCAMPPDIVAGMMEGMAGYDTAAAARDAGVPIRAIDGDLWRPNVARNRRIVPGFDAVVIPGTGHYPMLERPEEFDRRLTVFVKAFEQRTLTH